MIPILKDIIPIINPGQVVSVKSSELDEGTGQTEGMIRKGAIVGKCDNLCASGEIHSGINTTPFRIWQLPCSVMIAKPHSSSAIHHHGEQGMHHNQFRALGGRYSDRHDCICCQGSWYNHHKPVNDEAEWSVLYYIPWLVEWPEGKLQISNRIALMIPNQILLQNIFSQWNSSILTSIANTTRPRGLCSHPRLLRAPGGEWGRRGSRVDHHQEWWYTSSCQLGGLGRKGDPGIDGIGRRINRESSWSF